MDEFEKILKGKISNCQKAIDTDGSLKDGDYGVSFINRIRTNKNKIAIYNEILESYNKSREWNPISEAPGTSRDIELLIELGGKKIILVGKYINKKWYKSGLYVHEEIDLKSWKLIGWRELRSI